MILNLRQIDKFYLSGGWSANILKDIEYLKTLNIKAILDLQMSQADIEFIGQRPIEFILNSMKEHGIDYKAVPMSDDEFNINLGNTLFEGSQFLSAMEKKYPAKKDKILVKCGAGISRSPTQLINYLCQVRNSSYIDILSYIRMKEEYAGIGFGSSPNPIFADHLKKIYPDKVYADETTK